MDVLSRIRELLNGKKSQKRKSTFYTGEVESIKKSRFTDINGDYQLDSLYTNSGLNFDLTPQMRSNARRSESSLTNNSKSSFLTPAAYARNQLSDQHEPDPNYNFNNYLDGQRAEFKQPMPRSLTNGSKRIPALLTATKNTISRSFNRPQQTISPHFSRFGEQSELSSFKNVPDLYPIKTIRSDTNCSTSGNMINGHENYSMFSSNRYENQRPALSNSNYASTPSFHSGTSGTAFNNNSYKSMGLKSNCSLLNSGQINPPHNLSRTRYQNMLDLIPGMKYVRKPKKNAVDDSLFNAHGIIDLSEEAESRENKSASSSTSQVPNVERVNTLKARLETNELFKDDWEKKANEKYSSKLLSRKDSLKQVKEEAEECERKTRDTADRLKESFNKITISSMVYEEEEEEEPPNDYPPLEPEKQQKIRQWVVGRDSGSVLMSKFNLSITRHDIQTLQWEPLTWLNDEVINFFMELLGERSRSNEKLPKVHGMNTFFLKRLLENGYSGVRRWTRKVDIFSKDIIPVPVHKGIHWCMAIIHMKNKTIKYYDSMGAPNNSALNALAEYLKAESLDKKKVEFDMKGWTLENVRNIPQQENGSDCGVFSCMYAEFVTRNRPIVFSQQHMHYFRMKMVYEICTGQMLN